MAITTAIVRELMLAGLESEALLAALDRIEAASAPVLTKRQERDRRYYEAHREEKIAAVKARQSAKATENDGKDGNDGKATENDGNAGAEQRSPKNNNQTPKTSPSANASGEGDAPDGARPLPTKSKPKPRQPKVVATETPIDPDRKPDDRDREFAAERGLTGKQAWHEWEAFVAHHLKTGSLMVDWHGAWRTWVLRWKKREEEAASNGQQSARQNRTYPAARPEGTAARVAAIMGYGPQSGGDGSAEERRLPDRPAWPEGGDTARIIDAQPLRAGLYRA